MDDDVIVCPNCGETNAAELPYCQHCQWRLRPLDDEWGSQPDNTPAAGSSAGGAEPTKDETSYPDWLQRDHQQADDAGPSPGRRAEDDRGRSRPPTNKDLLAGLSKQVEPQDEEIPEWIARIMGPSEASTASDDGWPVDEGPPEGTSEPPLEFGAGRLKDQSWLEAPERSDIDLSSRGEANGWSAAATEKPVQREDDQIFEWLRQLDAQAASPGPPKAAPVRRASEEIPTWVDRMRSVPGGQAPAPADSDDAVPDWLVEPAPGQKPAIVTVEQPAGPVPEESRSLGVLGEAMPEAPTEASPRDEGSAPVTQRAAPAFAPQDVDRLDVDAVFASMRMPDWMNDVSSGQAPARDEMPPAAREEELIAPAELPSWVRAMRPVESAGAPAAVREEDTQLEERGPLLGLHGVLPSIPGAAVPSSKPETHSMRLEVSEQQQTHAALLERLLAAETEPLPFQGAGQFTSERVLRWAIGAILLLVLGGALLSGSRYFPLPAAVPNEGIAAVQAVQSLQPDARVLAVFDYEPATVGEMEATAASLMDHLLLLKHPRLTLISTSPTGAALAERFMSSTLADRAYVRGTQYANLGYLPGGLAGVQFFAQDPTAAVPLGVSGERVWDSVVLLGTRQLSDFAAIVVLTDSFESGRVWIEQTAATRGSSLMIIASSAQAGPMLLPYFDSGQVHGVIAGLNGAAGAEIANAGLPGFVRKYWDAYSLGLYIAALLIVIGGAWHFWLGFRERRMELGA